ncbi:MAG TPA: LysR family transcriptional regulator [Ramlibacter sp.]|nr:LysR family transcriptional regulator [Ramlibacter sp.]
MKWDDERISRRLKLRDLQYLLAVVQAGSMAKAAVALTVSQPVVSKAIADLEYTLGVQLLDRSPRGVEPTVYGHALVASSHAVFDELRQGAKEIRHLAQPWTGELTIGCNEATMLGLLPGVIDRLRVENPGLVLHVVQADTIAEQRRDLRERRIELAIGELAATRADNDLESEVLFDERLFVVAGAHNPWAQRGRVDLAELMDCPWVLPAPDSAAGQVTAEVFRSQSLPVPRAHVTAPFRLSSPLLEDGPFLSLLPASVLSLLAQNSRLKVVPVPLPLRAGPVGVIRLKQRRPGPLAVLFVDLLRSVAAKGRNAEDAGHAPGR